jgi:hypothetical protein
MVAVVIKITTLGEVDISYGGPFVVPRAHPTIDHHAWSGIADGLEPVSLDLPTDCAEIIWFR